MRTIILLIVFTGQFPDWMWPVTCVWWGLSCIKWWIRVARAKNSTVLLTV